MKFAAHTYELAFATYSKEKLDIATENYKLAFATHRRCFSSLEG